MMRELEDEEPFRPVCIVIGDRGPWIVFVFEICIDSGVCASEYAFLIACDADAFR